MRLSPDLSVNSKNILKYIELAKAKKIDLLCFPECALTGYIRNHRQVNVNGVSSEVAKLQKASDSSGVTLVVGSSLPLRRKIFNTAFIITPHNRIKKYFKLNLTDYDKKYFSHGTGVVRSFRIRGVGCGALICRDQNDPLLPRKFRKINVLLYLSSHYYTSKESKYRERKNKAFPIVRAIENKVYVAKADAVGSQAGLVSVGTSMIVHPSGVVLAEAPHMREALLELDL
jgi:NAD+ synthase (glutamine-hydrolysing)